MSHQPSMKDSTRYNNTLVDEYYRGFKEGEEHAKQRILIKMLPFLNDTQQRRLRKILENIDERCGNELRVPSWKYCQECE